MPDDLETQLALTAELVAKREQMGDAVETPRSIDHLIRVSRSRAGALVADLEAAGFRVRNRKSRIKASVEFDREDAVDQDSAAAFTREVVGIADRHGGGYDGWGALILPRGRKPYVPPDDAMPLSEVDDQAEQARLRALYVERLVTDGCPLEQAEVLSRKVRLRIGPDSWALESPSSSSISMTHYSPSEANELIEDVAEATIDDNGIRRKPLWQSVE